MIGVQKLKKTFNGVVLYENVDMNFQEGKINVITGPSGCGKTTLFRIIAGLDKDYEGTISNVPQNIAYIFQEDRLLPWLNIEENMHFVLRSLYSKEQMKAKTQEYLTIVKLYEERHKLPKELSGGMQCRVALARGFAYPSDLLLIDEPFKGLDDALKNQLVQEILKLQQIDKKTILLITHDLSVAKSLGDTLYQFPQY
jgi:NitT/TauT family transport system ATP-binding protein